jgi:hypothetical protein
VELESVWVTEDDLCERRTTSWVVDDILHNAANVSMTLGIIEVSELSWRLIKSCIRSESVIKFSIMVV